MLDADAAAQALRECQPELERLMSLNVHALDFYRATDKEKSEIIDAVYALVCCVMASESITESEEQE